MKLFTSKIAVETNENLSYRVDLRTIGVDGSLFMKIIGIYKITNPKGHIYIGQSINIKRRFNDYYTLNCKFQIRLKNSRNKYGVENHKFEIIHECLKEELNYWEDYYISFYDTFNTEIGMNLRRAGSKGEISKETRAKIAKALTGRPCSEKSKERLREYNKTRIWSEESKEKISKAHKGKYWGQKYEMTPEIREKMSRASKNRPHKPCSKEQKELLSKMFKGRKAHPNSIAAAKKPRKPLTEEQKNKLSKALKGKKRRPANEEEKKRLKYYRDLRSQKAIERKKLLPPSKGRIKKGDTIIFTEEHLKNLKDAHSSKEYKEKLKERVTEIWKKRRELGITVKHKVRPVCQISLDGFLINVFNSQTEAVINTGISNSKISSCVNNRIKSAGGYIWL